MSAKLEIPAALQNFTNNEKLVELPGAIVQQVFDELTGRYGELKQHLYDDKGELRSFINIYVNDQDIRYAGNLETPVNPGDVIHIIPSIAGG